MALFLYKALAGNGTVTSGELSAQDRSEAIRVLDKRGLQTVSLKEKSGAAHKDNKVKKQKQSKSGQKAETKPATKGTSKAQSEKQELPVGGVKLKRQEVILFTEELSEMLGAGLQLEPALRSMENRQELGSLKEVSQNIRQIVRDGSPFSSALQKVSPSFDQLYRSLAAAGEASGALDTILKRQTQYLKTVAELRSKIILAMIYPAFLVTTGVLVAVVVVTVLVPQLTALMQSTSGGELEGGLALIVGISDFMKEWWLVIILMLVAVGLFFKVWKNDKRNRPTWDRIKLGIPLYGDVQASGFYVQLLETMANLVANGMPLLRSLELCRDATLNEYFRENMNKVIDLVGDGRSLSRSLIRVGIFPSLLVDMVAVGEQTGQIDTALRRAADRYDKELNKSLQAIMALIMPVILIFMSVLVGGMVYIMINAILDSISNVGG